MRRFVRLLCTVAFAFALIRNLTFPTTTTDDDDDDDDTGGSDTKKEQVLHGDTDDTNNHTIITPASTTATSSANVARTTASTQEEERQRTGTTSKANKKEGNLTSSDEDAATVTCTPRAEVSSSSSCRVPDAWTMVDAKTITKPIWIPAFPGSGSEMVRSVVEAATGFCAGEIYAGTCTDIPGTVTCKTHWPQFLNRHDPRSHELRDSFQPSAVLLLRNPAKAIPSYVNWYYEYENSYTNHKLQAPEDYWIKHRDASSASGGGFARMIYKWKDFVVTWHKKNRRHNVSMYLQYERITSEREGPAALKAFAQHLLDVHVGSNGNNKNNTTTLAKSSTRTTTIISDKEAQCLWNQTIGRGKGGVKRIRTYEPAYKKYQQTALLGAIDSVRRKLADRSSKDLMDILTQYYDYVDKDLRIEGE